MDSSRITLADRAAYALCKRWYELMVLPDGMPHVSPLEYFYAQLTEDGRQGWRDLASFSAGYFRHRPPERGLDGWRMVRLTDEGLIPPEARGRHCVECGEEIEVTLGHGGPAQAGSAQEYVHKESRLAHCALTFDGDVITWLSESTASPCGEEGCLSNAEYEARQDSR